MRWDYVKIVWTLKMLTSVLVNLQPFIVSCSFINKPTQPSFDLYHHSVQTELRQLNISPQHSINALYYMNLLSSIREFNIDS